MYQSADINSHVHDYTTLPGTSHVSGSVHGGYGHNGCHHLHHKLPNGLPLLNGTSGLFSHGHDGTLPLSTRDCEHSHSHHHHNVSAKTTTPHVQKQCVKSRAASRKPSMCVLSPGWRHVHRASTDGVVRLHELSEPLQQQQVRDEESFSAVGIWLASFLFGIFQEIWELTGVYFEYSDSWLCGNRM